MVVPPRTGSDIFAIIGSSRNSRKALRKTVKANSIRIADERLAVCGVSRIAVSDSETDVSTLPRRARRNPRAASAAHHRGSIGGTYSSERLDTISIDVFAGPNG